MVPFILVMPSPPSQACLLIDSMGPPSDTDTATGALNAGHAVMIAAKLHGVPSTKVGEWARDVLGIEISAKSAERATAPTRFSSPHKEPRGRNRNRKPRNGAWITRDWLIVREEQLGLIKVLATIGQDPGSPNLLAKVSKLPGVRQVFETAATRKIVAIAIFTDALSESATRLRLEELSVEPVLWETLRSEQTDPALSTWSNLARSAAEAGNKFAVSNSSKK